MNFTKEQVLAALSHVEEPDLKSDLVSLNMIENIEISANKLFFDVVLTTPACPLKEKIENDCIESIHKYISDSIEVKVNLTARVTARKTEVGDLLPQVKNIIVVASGKGGVGKSTVATNLAIALAKSNAKVGLMDADIYGPSLPTMFNLQGKRPEMAQIGGKSYIIPLEKYGVQNISIGLLVDESKPIVWRGPMASSALRQFFTDVAWGELDYLVLDLPPGTGDIHLTIAQLVKVAGAVVVTSPQKVAVADARKGAAMFRMPDINIPILGIVENMAYFSPDDLPEKKYYLFGKGGGKSLSDEFGVPLLGQIPMVEQLADYSDRGLPIVNKPESLASQAFVDLAKNIAQQLAILNAQEKEKS